MLKKTFFVLTAVLLLCFSTSCSFIDSADGTGSVTLDFSKSAARLADSELENLYIDVSLQGDYSQTQTISAATEKSVTFSELLSGTSIYVEAKAYYKDSEFGNKIIYTGKSDTFTVKTGENKVYLKLTKIIEEKENFTVIFNHNDGTDTYDEQIIPSGEKASKPAVDPVRENDDEAVYEFTGWFTSNDGGKTLAEEPFDFDTPITKNLALYAKWKVSVTSPFEIEIPLDEIQDISVTVTENADKGTWIYTAESGYDTYKWKWDGEIQTTTSNIFETPEDAAPGKYQLTLFATKVVEGETEYYCFSERVTIK